MLTVRDFRFRPPEIDLCPELRWVLLRAFGPLGDELEQAIDPSRAHELAQQLEVSTRITARHGSSRLVAELGKQAARELVVEHLAFVARERAMTRSIEHIARLAAEHEVPLVFLKFAAMKVFGALLEGSRGASDVDVLVPEPRSHDLQAALEADGFEDLGFRGSEHQHPLLQSPDGGGVEVHRSVKGLRDRPGGEFVTFERLSDGGLLVPVQSLGTPLGTALPTGAYVPTRDCLLAHATVHAFVQHGNAPHAYPLSRMFADLIDLGVPENRGVEPDGAIPWLQEAMSPVEIDAVFSLCRALARGDGSMEMDSDSPAAVLLRHLVASALDVQYRNALRLQSAFHPLTARGPLHGFGKRFLCALVPTRAALSIIYGPPRSEAHLLALRLLRPLDLAYRAGKYGWSSLALKLRRSGGHRSG